MKTFIILLSVTILATATVLYVPLPADITKEQALNGNPEAKERIQQFPMKLPILSVMAMRLLPNVGSQF